MSTILYTFTPGPPTRAVRITAKSIGLKLEEKEVNLMKGEHMKPEYLRMNPQHTVPSLLDNGFTFWDSHVIMTYLVSKYARNDSLYPKDLKKRALVDQRLHFESGVLFKALGGLVFSRKEDDSENAKQVYSFLEAFLENSDWLAGDSVTVADYSIYCTLTCTNLFVAVDDQWPKLAAWVKKMAARPEVAVGEKGLSQYAAMVLNFKS